MTNQVIDLQLDSDVRWYRPGDTITGSFHAEEGQLSNARAAELSVLWYTAGKGEEDLAVHYFERFQSSEEARLDLHVRRRFAVRLPVSPLSYDGLIIKVCWCVRVRAFLPRGLETVAETPFRLGSVQPAGFH